MDELTIAREVVAGVLGCPVGNVGLDAAVGSLPQWDSIAHVSIILAAERKLGRMLTSEEIASFVSVGSLAAILARSNVAAATGSTGAAAATPVRAR